MSVARTRLTAATRLALGAAFAEPVHRCGRRPVPARCAPGARRRSSSPAPIRSTSRPRSSTRACRSAVRSFSRRSSRRRSCTVIPRTSASCLPTGPPSPNASRTASQPAWQRGSEAVGGGRQLDQLKVRALEQGAHIGVAGPSGAASASRSRARPSHVRAWAGTITRPSDGLTLHERFTRP